MEESVKEQLTARFRAYLDAAPDPAETSQQDSDAAVPDLFTLLAEVAALKNEIKLEGRNFKSALDEFRGLYATLREANTRLTEERARTEQQAQALDRHGEQQWLLELLDLRDRLQAGQQMAARFRPGPFAGRSATRFVASMAEGMAMNLRRLDEFLTRRGVQPLTVVGEPFDPHRMHAAELTYDKSLPTGQVVRELRTGFFHQDRLLRSAEVVVNRPRDS